uniref:Uncharacterized protein n=1 Tax=Arundo donax TaxID=35708 RepID=A0A0A8Y8B8_ARUDO
MHSLASLLLVPENVHIRNLRHIAYLMDIILSKFGTYLFVCDFSFLIIEIKMIFQTSSGPRRPSTFLASLRR